MTLRKDKPEFQQLPPSKQRTKGGDLSTCAPQKELPFSFLDEEGATAPLPMLTILGTDAPKRTSTGLVPFIHNCTVRPTRSSLQDREATVHDQGCHFQHTIPYYAIRYFTILYNTIRHYTLLYYTILYAIFFTLR